MIHSSKSANLIKEAYALHKLTQHKCKHVIKYYGEGKHNDSQYIMVEYLEYSIEDYMA
jgi:fructosamine-3-kinase